METLVNDIVHAPLDDLFHETKRIRSAVFGNTSTLCAVVNIKSGHCPMNCRFCAQSKHYDTAIETHPLLASGQLAQATNDYWKQDVLHVGWAASGCSPTRQELDKIVQSASSLLTGVGMEKYPKNLCASLGQLDSHALQQLKSAGFCRYHHNLETSLRFYPSLCTTQRWEDRRATIERAKESGLSVCSGGLFGLGETWEDRLQLALTLKELEVDSVPINFYSPIQGTPLGHRQSLSLDEALRIVVLFRRILPKAAIRICGGRPTIISDRRQDVLLLQAGANALMTGNYLTTSGISPEIDKAAIKEMSMRGEAS